MADILELTRLSYIVVLGASVYNTAAGILDPTIAIYLEVLGSSSEEIGSILAVRWLLVAIASIPFALLSSKIGKVPVLQLSALFATIAGFILVNLENTDAVYYFYLFVGLAFASASGPAAAILAENEGTKRIAAFALFSTTWMVPTAIGSAISAFWFEETTEYTADNLSSIFILVLYVMLFGAILFYFMLHFNRREEKMDENRKIGISKEFRILFAPIIFIPLVLLIAVNFMTGAGAGATLPFLPPYLKSLGATPTEISLLVLVLNLLMGVMTQLSAPLASKFGELKVFAVATLLSTVFLVSLVFSEDLYVASLFYILRGTFANMTAPISQARVLSYIDSRVRATGSAIATNVRWVGWVIFSPISGKIIDEHGYQTSFVFTALIYVFATILFVWTNAKYPTLDELRQTSNNSQMSSEIFS